MKLSRKFWPWLKVLVAVGIIAALVWKLGTSAFLQGLRDVSIPSVLAAVGIGALTTVCCAWRWCVVARGLGLELSLRRAVSDYYRAMFLNSVLPTGVLGDVHRAVRHGQSEGDVGRGVRAVVLERTGGQVVLIVLSVVVLLVQPAVVATEVHAIVPAAVVLAIALGVLAVAIAAVVRWGRPEWKVRRAITTTLGDVRQGLLTTRTWPSVLLLSTVVLAGHLSLFLVAARAAGSTVPLAQLVPLMVLALLASGLPVNIGGWGPRESVSALVFGAAGLGAAQGLTIAVVYGVLTIVTCLPGAVVLLRDAFRRRALASRGDSGPDRAVTEVQFEQSVDAEHEATRRSA
jgi:uncharacterized membrane protein YbhN (UPF0104 family)